MAKGEKLKQGEVLEVMQSDILKEAYQWKIKPYKKEKIWYFDSYS